MTDPPEFQCPHCENRVVLDVSRGDLHPCPRCSERFWALEAGSRGMVFELRAPSRGPLWAFWVLAVSLFVLFAELALAAAIYGGAAYGLWSILQSP